MNRKYTDKQLLEFAAKAAGINLIRWLDDVDDIEPMFSAEVPVEGRESEYPEVWSREGWNPFIYDDDNRKLQVKLAMDLTRCGEGWEARVGAAQATCGDADWGGSAPAARRAVAYLASLIGRNME